MSRTLSPRLTLAQTLAPRLAPAPCLLLAILLLFGVFNLHFLKIDPPYALATWSAELVTDEGLHTKAAQLAVKTGHWSLPMDMDISPAAPLFNVVAFGLYTGFGPNLIVGRTYSVIIGLITSLVFYVVLRTTFNRSISVWIALATAVNFQVSTYSRLFLIEPTAILMCLLAVLVVVKGPAMPSRVFISIMLGTVAAFVKWHFLPLLGALGLFHLWEIRCHWHLRRHATKMFVALFLGTLTCIATILGYGLLNEDKVITVYHDIIVPVAGGDDMTPPGAWWQHELDALVILPYTTKAVVPLAAIMVFGVWALMRKHDRKPRPETRLITLSAIWLLVAGFFIGLVAFQPPRYSLFKVYLLTLLATYLVTRVLPLRWQYPAIITMLCLTIVSQLPLYYYWLKREPNYSFWTAMTEVADLVKPMHLTDDRVVVIGEPAATLGLMVDWVHPIEVLYLLDHTLCEHLAHWRPAFYLGWSNERPKEVAELRACLPDGQVGEIKHWEMFRRWKDDLYLYRITY